MALHDEDAPEGSRPRQIVEPEGAPETPDAERYAFEGVLGQGGMGEVQLCRDRRIGREVALKVTREARDASGGPSSRDELERRFVREAFIQGQLEHPAVVPVYDLGARPDGSAFFTMKHIRGVTLEKVLEQLRADQRRGARPHVRQHRLLGALANVCLAVHFAHLRGVVHRDLKPANVMLGDFGEVYVLDWGVAKLRVTDEASDEPPLSKAGAVVGTPGYVAPEQLAGVDIDGRADVYSLGCLLFEILTLKPLHGAGSEEQRVSSTLIGVDVEAAMRASGREVAPELARICVRATSPARVDRFPDARALHEALDHWLEGDRDVELRRKMSASHADAAQLSVLDGASDLATTTEAMRELFRALALDPRNERAVELLVHLLSRTPRETPPEVEADIARRLALTQQVAARQATIGHAAFLGILALVLWMGVRSWVALGIFLAALACSAAVSAVRGYTGLFKWSRLGAAALMLVGVAALTRLFGPLVLAPTVAAGISLAFASNARSARERAGYVAAGQLAIFGPVLLELAGVLPPSYRFEGGTMVIIGHMAGLPELPSLLMLGLGVVLGTVIPAFVVSRAHDALRESERRQLVHAWQLRQVVPEGARSEPPAS